MHRECAGDGGALLLPAREMSGIGIALIRNANALQKRFGLGEACTLRFRF
jgi:hypothetical protein